MPKIHFHFSFYTFVQYEIMMHEQAWSTPSNPSPCTKTFGIKLLMILPFFEKNF